VDLVALVVRVSRVVAAESPRGLARELRANAPTSRLDDAPHTANRFRDDRVTLDE
jgi:hypothetical protein